MTTSALRTRLAPLVLLVPLLVATVATAQDAAPLDLATAVRLAVPRDEAVLDARDAREDAARDAERAAADPTATTLARQAARDAAAAAADDVRVAEAEARREVTARYVAVLEARAALADAEARERIADAVLAAERVRLEAGAATDLDVARAQDDAAARARTRADAATDRALAEADLRQAIGRPVGALAPVGRDALASVPALDVARREAREASASLRAARRDVTRREAERAGLATPLSSANERADADAALADARTRLARTETAVDDAVRRAHAALVASANRLADARDAVATSATSLEASRARFEAGTIAEATLHEAEASHAQVVASRDAALHARLLAEVDLRLAQLR